MIIALLLIGIGISYTNDDPNLPTEYSNATLYYELEVSSNENLSDSIVSQ